MADFIAQVGLWILKLLGISRSSAVAELDRAHAAIAQDAQAVQPADDLAAELQDLEQRSQPKGPTP